MSPVETAWVAGLLEGEGAFVVSWVERKNRWRYPTIRVQMNQTDEDVVRKLGRLAGGMVRGPYPNSGKGDKPVWRWELGRRDALIALLHDIRPHMGARRTARIDELLAIHAEHSRYRERVAA